MFGGAALIIGREQTCVLLRDIDFQRVARAKTTIWENARTRDENALLRGAARSPAMIHPR